jgi:hypothetical protein
MFILFAKTVLNSIIDQLKSGKATGAEEFEGVTVFFSDIPNMAQLTSNATVCTLFLFCAHFFASFGI